MIIEAKNLSIGYKSKKANHVLLNSTRFVLHKGAVYSIFGANGVGKSTLIQTLCGIIAPLSGEVFIGNRALSKIPKKELAKLISIVLTDRPIIDYLTVYDFVAFGRTPYTDFTGFLSQEDHSIITDCLKMTSISHKSSQLINSLSDGEFQKAIIARALAQQTPIIIMDEPASYLDYANQIELMSLLHKLASESGKTILLSLHHLNLAIDYANFILLFNRDQTLTIGSPEDLILNEQFNEVYTNDWVTFDSMEGGFKRIYADAEHVNVDAPPLQKKWILHALCKHRLEKTSFLIKFQSDRYLVFSGENEIASLSTIAQLIATLKELSTDSL